GAIRDLQHRTELFAILSRGPVWHRAGNIGTWRSIRCKPLKPAIATPPQSVNAPALQQALHSRRRPPCRRRSLQLGLAAERNGRGDCPRLFSQLRWLGFFSPSFALQPAFIGDGLASRGLLS